jgi:hypothetical protein
MSHDENGRKSSRTSAGSGAPSEREIHNQSVRRRKVVIPWLRFLEDYIVLYLNINPFFASWRSYLVDLKATDCVWHVWRWSPYVSIWKAWPTHCWEGPIRSGIGTPRLEQNQVSRLTFFFCERLQFSQALTLRHESFIKPTPSTSFRPSFHFIRYKLKVYEV